MTRQLLILNGATLERCQDGGFVTKVPLRDYVCELTESFDSVIWLAPLYSGPPGMSGNLAHPRVVLVPYRATMLGVFVAWVELFFILLRRPYVLWFLPSPMLPVLPVAWLLSRRLIAYLAGDFRMTLAQDAERRGRLWAFRFRLSFELPLRWADTVIARGKGLARLASQFNDSVVETMPLGHMSISPNLHTTCVTGNINLLFIGKLLWSKGLGDLLQAWKIVLERHPDKRRDLHLDIIGDGSDRTGIQALATSLGIDAFVTFQGFIDTPHLLNEFFARSVSLVMPTTTHPEGVPRVIDEALVRNVPVVATRVGGIVDEFAEDEVMLIEPGNTGQLASAIDQLLFDETVRQRYLAGAQRRKEMWARHGSAARQHAGVLLGQVQ